MHFSSSLKYLTRLCLCHWKSKYKNLGDFLLSLYFFDEIHQTLSIFSIMFSQESEKSRLSQGQCLCSSHLFRKLGTFKLSLKKGRKLNVVSVCTPDHQTVTNWDFFVQEIDLPFALNFFNFVAFRVLNKHWCEENASHFHNNCHLLFKLDPPKQHPWLF